MITGPFQLEMKVLKTMKDSKLKACKARNAEDYKRIGNQQFAKARQGLEFCERLRNENRKSEIEEMKLQGKWSNVHALEHLHVPVHALFREKK